MSIENPRQEAGEPRVPELWWSPRIEEIYTRAHEVGLTYLHGPEDGVPSDVVKLGDVEALRTLLDQTVHAEMVAKQQLAEIRAALRDWSEHDEIRDILDREPGREEPTRCPDGECNQGMCSGAPDPCGGCCGCLGGCLDEEGSPSAIAAEELAALMRPKAAAGNCPSCAGLGDVPCGHVVEHQPAQDSVNSYLPSGHSLMLAQQPWNSERYHARCSCGWNATFDTDAAGPTAGFTAWHRHLGTQRVELHPAAPVAKETGEEAE